MSDSFMKESFLSAASVSLIFLLFGFCFNNFNILTRVASWISWSSYLVKARIHAWLFLWHGTQQIRNAYQKARGEPFKLQAPDHNVVFVSSRKHVKEVDMAASSQLSLYAATKQMFQPQYTMHGFNWVDRRGADGIGFVRALRSLLTSHLPILLPDMRTIIEQEFTKSLYKGKKTLQEPHSIPAFSMMKGTVAKVNGLVFFGRELMEDDEFMDAAFETIENVIWAAECLRVLPAALQFVIGRLFAKYFYKTHELYFNVLKSNVEHRLNHQRWAPDGQRPKDHPTDITQWVIDTSPRDNPWSADRIVHEIMALWFASIHGLSITVTYAVYAMCRHPEDLEPLRDELQSSEYDTFVKTAQGLPLLDSFIKESARMSPADSMTSRRAALVPFSLSDGTQVRAGDWVCVPMEAMMYDPELYPNPDSFNAFRFVDPKRVKNGQAVQPEGESKFTDPSYKWGMWGNFRTACATMFAGATDEGSHSPARFHATLVMKLIMAHILTHYDCRLETPKVSCSTTWRSYNLPRDETRIIFQPR